MPKNIVVCCDGTANEFALADPNGKLHESLEKAWWAADLIPKRHYDSANKKWERRMNKGRRRMMPPASLVHVSVFQRAGDYKSRLPATLSRFHD
jgi:hypothetical protein